MEEVVAPVGNSPIRIPLLFERFKILGSVADSFFLDLFIENDGGKRSIRPGHAPLP